MQAAAMFDQSFFMPHGHCYLWTPWLLWMNVIPDLLIAAAYFAIPAALLRIVRRRRDLPFNWMFVCFGVFIVACGTTHLVEAWNVWNVDYWLAAGIKVLTALASVPTAVLLFRLVPQIVALPSPAQLAAANAALREANQQMEAANRGLESFSYSVSHDLRAPLRAIDGFSQAVLEDFGEPLQAQGRRYLERIRAEAQRMDALIQSLLKLARVGTGGLLLTRVDVTALAQRVAHELQEASGARTVVLEVAPALAAEADEPLLTVVLQNLLSNAYKFTSGTAQARVLVGMRRLPDGEEAFYVQDNGAGFDPQHVGRLFRTFERLHSDSEFPGTGIGLATVRRIIERHGGRVWAESTPGKGATFWFTLASATAIEGDATPQPTPTLEIP